MSLITDEMRQKVASSGGFYTAQSFIDNPLKVRIQGIESVDAGDLQYTDKDGKITKYIFIDEYAHEKILKSASLELLQQIVNIDPEVDDVLEIVTTKVPSKKGEWIKWSVKKITSTEKSPQLNKDTDEIKVKDIPF